MTKRVSILTPLLLPLFAGCPEVIGPVLRGDLQSRLDANRVRWAANGITSYEYRYSARCFCLPTNAIIHVEDGRVTSARQAEDDTPIAESEFYRFATIETLFDYIQASIRSTSVGLNVHFDLDLGFPTYYSADGDLIVTDGGFTITVNDFTPL